MVLKDNVEELDLTLNFRHDEFNYVIYATTNTMKCFGCGENGHLIRGCPKRVETATAQTVVSENVAEVQNDVAAVDDEMPGPSRAPVGAESVKNGAEFLEGKMVEKDRTAATEIEKVRSSLRTEQTIGGSDESEGGNSEDEAVVNPEDEGSLLGDEGCFFKIPQKRKLMECLIDKQAKRTDSIHMSQTDTESESDISECSVTASLPQSGFSS